MNQNYLDDVITLYSSVAGIQSYHETLRINRILMILAMALIVIFILVVYIMYTKMNSKNYYDPQQLTSRQQYYPSQSKRYLNEKNQYYQ